MKTLSFLFLILAAPAMAQPSRTVIQTTATVDLHQLNCVLPIGSGDTYTEITSNHSVFLSVENKSAVELKHVRAIGDGCAKAKLEKIQKQAMMGYGFLYGVPVTVTKEVSASVGDSSSGCVADYLETVKIDLGLGVSVSSQLVDTRPAHDCN